MLTAKEIMVTEVVTIPPETTIGAAVDMMLQNRISGMPVTNEDHSLLGIISEFALMAISYDAHLDSDPVSEHMTFSVVTIEEDADLRTISDLMISQRLRRVPVVRGNKLVGTISRRDVLRAVRNSRQEQAV